LLPQATFAAEVGLESQMVFAPWPGDWAFIGIRVGNGSVLSLSGAGTYKQSGGIAEWRQ
jgi:hypothetical protein